MSDPTTATPIETNIRNIAMQLEGCAKISDGLGNRAMGDELDEAAEKLQDIADAHRAEIERLTAALETARAERDAAYSVIKQVSAVLHAPQTMRSDEQVAHEYRLIYDIVLTYEDGVDTAPQPAAAPAVDAAPVGERETTLSFQSDTPMWAIDLLNADHYFKQGNEHRALETIIDYLKGQAGYEALAAWAELTKVVPMINGGTQS
jgi:hypothetical protein